MNNRVADGNGPVKFDAQSDSKQYDNDDLAMVRAGPLVNLPFLLRSFDADPAPVFASVGIRLSEFEDPDHKYPYLQASRLLAACVDATGCQHLGLLLGEMAEPSHLGLPGFLVHAAPTVEQALRTLVETLDLHDEGGTAKFDKGDDYSTLNYAVELQGAEALEAINDLSTVMLCKIMGLLCGANWSPNYVRLQRREPADRTPYRRIFRGPVYFNSTVNEVGFNSLCLADRPPTADALLFRHLMQEAEILHDLHRGELMHVLPTVLQRGLLSERFSAPEIADVFGFHERTLHRRLRAAGTSFRQELDQARRKLSEQLLQSTSLAVGDIATALGYADASGFIRAFERWCGSSPAVWRKENFLRE